MRALFAHAQTLHMKVAIPVAIRLAEQGHEVAFERRGKPWQRFSDRYVRAHPTTVGLVDRRALRFVAEVIGYEDEWTAVERDIALVRGPDPSFDAIVGTTKDLARLRELRRGPGVPAYALGYQHMPYLVEVGARPEAHPNGPGSFFLRRNEFTEAHRFLEILNGDRAVPNSFTFLDRVLERRTNVTETSSRVLIFHPGGYRDVVTSPGDPREVCIHKQVAFFERACLPIVRKGLTPVIKVHPLRARHHDYEDVMEVSRRIEAANGIEPGTIRCIGPRGWFWDEAFRAAFVVNYGSSAIYELWSAGVRSAVVCNFEGRARSEKFSAFEGIFLDEHEAYRDFIEQERFRRLRPGPLAQEVSRAYQGLCDGRATERAARFIATGSAER
jgi:hypothetical protein